MCAHRDELRQNNPEEMHSKNPIGKSPSQAKLRTGRKRQNAQDGTISSLYPGDEEDLTKGNSLVSAATRCNDLNIHKRAAIDHQTMQSGAYCVTWVSVTVTAGTKLLQ